MGLPRGPTCRKDLIETAREAWTVLIGLERGREKGGSYEGHKKPSGSMKGERIIDQTCVVSPSRRTLLCGNIISILLLPRNKTVATQSFLGQAGKHPLDSLGGGGILQMFQLERQGSLSATIERYCRGSILEQPRLVQGRRSYSRRLETLEEQSQGAQVRANQKANKWVRNGHSCLTTCKVK
jgi:hypothetical protein